MELLIFAGFSIMIVAGLLVYLMHLIKGVKKDAFELAQNALLIGKSQDLAEAAASKDAFSPSVVSKEEPLDPSIPTADGGSIPLSHLERIS